MKLVATPILAILLVPLAAQLALASDPECVPGTFTGACSFSGATLGGVYVYDSITIPAGVTVTATLPLVLHARQELRVEGDIVDTPRITLTSDLVATVTGTVRAADGTRLQPVGGDVHVAATSLNFHGTLQSGTGAPGEDMVRDLEDTAASVTATSTSGGKGGDIVVSAASVNLNGLFIVGNGGKGGSATALGGTLSATAIGGEGGPSGNVVLPAGYTPMALAGMGRLLGGAGGDGGDATATPWRIVPLPSTYGSDGYGDWEDFMNDNNQPRPCDGQPTTSPPGATGREGCSGASAYASAGNGGYGLQKGGWGGNAAAWGGAGGNGGRGANGNQGSCYYTSDWQPPCPAFYGGQGGRGGTGGRASAYGGKGGDSLIEGGHGGNAYALGGTGGMGGKGGTNGGGWVVNWDGSTRMAVWTAIGCAASIASESGTAVVVACGAFVFNHAYYYVCGDPGRPGPGGWGGDAWADAGEGGRNAQGLGLQAASGVSSGSNGDYGSQGQWGDRQQIPVGIMGGGGIPVVIYACG